MLEIDAAQKLGSAEVEITLATSTDGVLALFGPSGAGKTTILNWLAGLGRPDRGRIRLNGTTLFDRATGVNLRWNPDFRSASLGYCFTEAAWGHGYATETARAVLQWGFDTLPLNRVQAETDTRNVASARVLEKLGFVREGTLREDCVVNGDVSDSWVYGLLRREWQPVP
jgi:RimJ/RimL family protein N-acetyltransferase